VDTLAVVNRSDRTDRLLLAGPHSRLKELWLLLRALRDFIAGFRTLHFAGPCVTVFGSARYTASHPHYAVARDVGRSLAELGFTVMTGGGPGLMEAANRGAREANGRSVGCNIRLPREQGANEYLDRVVTCHYFFVRKVLLFKYSCAFVGLPGGLGTLDELFEALTLVQTGKIRSFPIVLAARPDQSNFDINSQLTSPAPVSNSQDSLGVGNLGVGRSRPRVSAVCWDASRVGQPHEHRHVRAHEDAVGRRPG
jgi:uncharacterized protein (TIGR00730 family)